MQITYRIILFHIGVNILLENSDTLQKVLFEFGLQVDKLILDWSLRNESYLSPLNQLWSKKN